MHGNEIMNQFCRRLTKRLKSKNDILSKLQKRESLPALREITRTCSKIYFVASVVIICLPLYRFFRRRTIVLRFIANFGFKCFVK